MTNLGIQMTAQVTTAAPSLGVSFTCSVELCTEPSVPPSSPPTDLEIVRLKRRKAAVRTALPRPGGVTNIKGGPCA